MFLVEAVGFGQEAVGGKRGAILIVTSCQEIIFREFFVSGVIVDDGDSAMVANIFVVADDVILGIGDVDFHLTGMVLADLLFVHNRLASFFGISGDIGEGHW